MDATYMALAAVAVAVLAMLVSFTLLTDYLARIPERTMNVITKFGGLIIATIGAQLALNGIKMFFELG